MSLVRYEPPALCDRFQGCPSQSPSSPARPEGLDAPSRFVLSADFDIVGVARSDYELESLAQEIEARGGSCRPRVVDITNPEAVAAALSGVDAQVLVNNAGVGTLKPFMELTRDEWTRMVNVNFNALFDVTRAVLSADDRAASRGTSSSSGRSAAEARMSGGTCYAATKHAAMAFSESLMLELRDSGVKVSIVNPGSVATHFSERVRQELDARPPKTSPSRWRMSSTRRPTSWFIESRSGR